MAKVFSGSVPERVIGGEVNSSFESVSVKGGVVELIGRDASGGWVSVWVSVGV